MSFVKTLLLLITVVLQYSISGHGFYMLRTLELTSTVVRVTLVTMILGGDVTIYILWRCLVRPRFSILRDLPQPPTTGGLLTGHVRAVFSMPLGRQITEWMNNIPNDGLLFFRGVLGAEYLVVTDTDGLRDVLFARAYDFEKTSAFRRYTRRFLAAGLVVQEGQAHKMRRKAVGPVFRPQNVDALKPLMCAKSQQLVQVLRKVCDQQSNMKEMTTLIDICDWSTRFALDLACTVGFGENLGLVNSREVHPILRAYTTIFTGSKEKMTQYAWHNTSPGWLSKLFPHSLDEGMDEASLVVKELALGAVRKRIELIQAGGHAPQDFLTEIILSGKFDVQECADELVIMMAAAHESTAALIAMTVYRLCERSELQYALRQELSGFGLCAGHDFPISDSQYEKMTMLNALLNEMMRLEPPLPITLRKTVRDTIVGGHSVRAGTYIVISPYAMGRSRTIWGPSASTFDPYRWITPYDAAEQDSTRNYAATTPQNRLSTEKIQSPLGRLNEHGGVLGSHQYGMLTFLKGPKGCTGERFAKAEMRRVIAKLIAEFEWTSAQSHEPEQVGIVVVKPAGGIAVRLRPIQPRVSI